MARDRFEEAIEAVLSPMRPMTLPELEQEVTLRLVGPELRARLQGRTIGGSKILVLLRGNPDRFLEVAKGRWVRRSDGPEAGVPSRRPRPPLAGGAAAQATPPAPSQPVIAVARPQPAA